MDPASPELKALLQRCREAPADDMPRLVLADWLDEQGDCERAAFIRVQVALSHPSADATCQAELKGLEQSLLAAHAEAWIGELRPILTGLRYGREDNRGILPLAPRNSSIWWDLGFHRGLLHLQQLDPDWLLDPALRTWMRAPSGDWLEEVKLAGDSPDSFERMQIPSEFYGRINLDLRRHAFYHPPSAGRRIPQDEFPIEVWRRFVRNPKFPAIRTLSTDGGLNFLRELGEADVRRLISLGARGAAASPAASARILGTIPFESLSSLDLGPVTADSVREVIASPFLRNLAEWNLVGCPLGDAGMIALCESPLAESLTAVSFPNTGIGDSGVRALVSSPIFGRMNSPSLNLMMNRLGDAGVQALAESEHLLRYRELVLRENQCGDSGAAAIAESRFAANLTYVDFWRNRIGDAGAVALSQSKYLGGVVDLCAKENELGPNGVAALLGQFGDRAKV